MARARVGDLSLADVFDLFNREWTAPVDNKVTRCIECGRKTTNNLTFGPANEPVCEVCASALSEVLLTEGV